MIKIDFRRFMNSHVFFGYARYMSSRTNSIKWAKAAWLNTSHTASGMPWHRCYKIGDGKLWSQQWNLS